jgi:hypothetical protein
MQRRIDQPAGCCCFISPEQARNLASRAIIKEQASGSASGLQETAMVNTGIVHGLTTSRPPTLEQAKRQNRRDRFLVILAIILLSLLITLVALLGIQQAWQSASWGDTFWQDTLLTKVFLPYISVSVGLFEYSAYFAFKGQERIQGIEAYPLRQAAATGDDRLAPLAADQPDQLPSAERVIHPEGESFKVRGTTKETRFTIRVDEQGIEWKHIRRWLPGRTQRIAWSEARAFYAFNYRQWSGSPWGREEAYVLDAPNNTLAWVLSLPWSANPQQDQRATERLLRLIATYTGLPLRDLTDAVDKLDVLMSDVPATATLLKEQQATAVSLFSATLTKLPQPVKPAKRRLFAYSGLTPLLLMGLIAATAFGLQTYQQSSYTAMLAHIHAHQPLYHDALHAPDADWHTHLPGPDAPGSFTFKDNAYQLTGDDFIGVPAPGLYGDVAVEVTVRLYANDTNDLFNSFGLLLHGDDPLLGIVFEITADGYWSIGPIQRGLQQTSAIHQGIGATNRLAVIMRGQQYLCYINGQFVGISQTKPSSTGSVGLYAESDQSQPAPVIAFTDFTIYPL